MIVIHWRGIIRFRGIPRSYTIPLPSRYCFSANCSNNSFLLIQCAFTFYPWKTFNWFSIAPQHLLTTSLKRPAEPIYNPPLPSVSPRILGNVHDNFAYKNSDLQVHRFIITLLLERVCNRRPLLRSFERYACIFTRTGRVSLRFTLFPQRYRFFFSPLNNRFLFLSFFFFQLPLLLPSFVRYCLVESDSRW